MKHTTPRRIAIVALLFALLLTTAALAADPPGLVHYQGVLRDNQNLPLDGDFDMEFHFFDQLANGNEILVDTHAGGNAVTVTGGLFAVALGGGVVTDGAANLPTDPHTLASMFQNFDEVWLEIRVGAETLSPRTRVMSAAYAQNSSALGGLAADQFVNTTAADQVKSGALTVGGLSVQGDINLIDPFFQSLRFSDGGGFEAFRWDGADHVFEMTSGLQMPSPLTVGDIALFPVGYNRFGTGSSPQSGEISGGTDLFIGDDLEAGGEAWFGSHLEVGGLARFNGEIWMDDDGPDGDQRFRFWNGGSLSEELKWDLAGDRFEFSDSLAIAGSLRTGNTAEVPEGFNHLGSLGKTPDSDDMSGPQDLYVEGDVEVEETLYLNGEIMMLDLGPDLDGDGSGDDVDQFIFFYDNQTMDDEWIKWDNSATSSQGGTVDRFEMSDSLHVYGDLTALNKNFVQNYPGRDDLEIVYTTLEGDEATVFTRGHGKLVNGQARLPLGPTFPMIANPDLGLSAHLTPRGTWADLYVVELTPDELVVGSRDGAAVDVSFDYIVYGLRLGYEDQPVVRPRRADAPIPALDHWDAVYAAMPEARASTARTRYVAMDSVALGRRSAESDSDRALQLRQAIGEGIFDVPAERAQRRTVSDLDEAASAQLEARVRNNTNESQQALQTEAAEYGAGNTGGATAVAAVTGAQPNAAPRDLVARSFRPERGGVAAAWSGGAEIEPGDVVAIDPDHAGGMRRAEQTEDPTVIGIATQDAGVLFGADSQNGASSKVAVALSGIVICKVDATYGAIQPGDLLVASATPGHAMRRDNPLPGTVVGKALESLDDGTGTIRVLVVQR